MAKTIYIQLDLLYWHLIAVAVGLIMGILMVMLDPVLRFSDIPTRINWTEALLSGMTLAGYAFLLGWMISEFWRTLALWAVVFVTTPMLVGIVVIWNDTTAIFAETSDFLIFVPIVLLVHATVTLLTILYLNIVKRLSARQPLAYTAIPVVTVALTILVIGQLRWQSQDAKDVMAAVNRYAGVAIQNQDYQIEYLGIRYQEGFASQGHARIHTNDFTLRCDVRMIAESMDVNCEREDE